MKEKGAERAEPIDTEEIHTTHAELFAGEEELGCASSREDSGVISRGVLSN